MKDWPNNLRTCRCIHVHLARCPKCSKCVHCCGCGHGRVIGKIDPNSDARITDWDRYFLKTLLIRW